MELDRAKIYLKPTNVYYLKMNHRPNEKMPDNTGFSYTKIPKPINPSEYSKYYREVGLKLNWLDRLVMPTEELSDKINSSNVDIFLMKTENEDADAGFLELVREERYVELLYFGLFPSFIGKGLGKYFLHWSIHKAWSYNPEWIQLNTCDLDHVNALPMYRKLGFIEYKTTIENRRVYAGY